MAVVRRRGKSFVAVIGYRDESTGKYKQKWVTFPTERLARQWARSAEHQKNGDADGVCKTCGGSGHIPLTFPKYKRWPESFVKQPIEFKTKPSRCQICLKVARVAWDHDHVTGKFRGWICTKCNTMLGMSGDSVNTLLSAAEYLQGFAAREALISKKVLQPSAEGL